MTHDTREHVSVRLPPEPHLVPRGSWFDWLTLALLVAVTVALAAETPLIKLDIAIRAYADANRPVIAEIIATGLNYLGQGMPLTLLCLGLAIWQSRRLGTWEPVLPVVCAFTFTYVSIGAIKFFTDRGAPHYGSVLLFSEATGQSYPSGHAANVIVWYGVLTMLLSPFLGIWPRRLLRYGPPILVAFATTYLGYHWFTDAIAGLLVGILVDRMLRRNPWRHWPWLMERLNRKQQPGLARTVTE